MEHRLKLVACDLDGTLLLNGSQKLEPEIFGIIRELKERGVRFVAASGRQYPNLRRLFEPVQDDITYICENGALVMDQGKALYKGSIDRKLGQEILGAIRERKGCEILLSGENTSYIQPKDERYLIHMRDVIGNHCTVVEDIMDTPEEYLKISVYEEDGITGCENYFTENFSDKVKVVTSGYAWLDMVAKGIDKGSAMAVIRKKYGILPEECAAFGDNYNDEEMLRQVGFDFAMDTAEDGIKAICHYHTATVEEALTKILKGEMKNVRI